MAAAERLLQYKRRKETAAALRKDSGDTGSGGGSDTGSDTGSGGEEEASDDERGDMLAKRAR